MTADKYHFYKFRREWRISHKDETTGEIVRSAELYTLKEAADICNLLSGVSGAWWITLEKSREAVP